MNIRKKLEGVWNEGGDRRCSACRNYFPLALFYKRKSECKTCSNYSAKKLWEKNKEKRREYTRKCIAKTPKDRLHRNNYVANLRLKIQVLWVYSHGTMQCACCDESNWKFLTINHINGGGRKHRMKIGGAAGFYRWLRTNGFPIGFDVLCFNCNQAKYIYGECPHK